MATPRKKPEDYLPMGAPTKYKDEYPLLMLDYFEETIDFSDEQHPFYRKGWKSESFPTKAGFAVFIGVAKDTLHEWSTAKIRDEEGNVTAYLHPDFSASYKRVENFQERNLVSGAMNGELNTTFSIFFAKNNLGYTDKTENDQNHKGSVDVVHKVGSQKARDAIESLTGKVDSNETPSS